MQVRNRRYDSGKADVRAVQVPVISVGNLTVGGTGKTPMVAWLARWFRARNKRVCLISRGYGAAAQGVNDEALELEQKLPDVPHLQNPDRHEAATIAVEELQSELILLDDGFQHRRLGRQLDVVLIDSLEPFGYNHLLPRGLLREPLSSLSRADVVVFTRADLVSQEQRTALESHARRWTSDARFVHASHRPTNLLSASGRRESWESISGPVASFCGIGNPEGFQKTLKACGLSLADHRTFPDHHAYQTGDVEELQRWAESLNASALVCTCKDLVKLRAEQLGQIPLWALAIEMELLEGEKELEECLERVF